MSLTGLVRSQFVKLSLLIWVIAALSSCAGNAPQNQPRLTSIDVSPVNATLAIGTSQQFTAVGHFSDGSAPDISASVVWNSQSSNVAIINSSGMATAKSAGSTLITATSGSVVGSMTLTVAAATLKSIAVTPANPTLARNATQQFTEIGRAHV